MPERNRQVLLKRRPEGMPTSGDFDIVDAPLPEPKTGESVGDKKNVRTDFSTEGLREQFDSFSARFTAVEDSLRRRALDLGNQPIKPEITATLQTARSDLVEAKDALAAGDIDRAKRRLQRITEELSYLESL